MQAVSFFGDILMQVRILIWVTRWLVLCLQLEDAGRLEVFLPADGGREAAEKQKVVLTESVVENRRLEQRLVWSTLSPDLQQCQTQESITLQ